MDWVKSIWIVLADDAVPCCNEGELPTVSGPGLMDVEVLQKVVSKAKQGGWRCTILANRQGLPQPYARLFDQVQAEVVLPAAYDGPPLSLSTTFVFDSDEIEPDRTWAAGSRATLRVRRRDLPKLAGLVISLFGHFRSVSLRHPDLTVYTDDDLSTYRDELLQVGQWLLDHKADWRQWRLDCLTDRFSMEGNGECGAGDVRLAVSPRGELHLCPVAMRAGLPSYGNVHDEVHIPNRHLFARAYSQPCGSCQARHCLRCVYQNKLKTREFCVPARSVCQLAHHELEAQALLAQQAIAHGFWDEKLDAPERPVLYDPVVSPEDEVTDFLDFARRFTGRAKDLQPPLMLEMIHELQGHLQSLLDCREAGCVPSAKVYEQDPIMVARHLVFGACRDVVLGPGVPTVQEIMSLMREAVARRPPVSCGRE